jgi:4-amino-4-deoxy-L-arabinose transferase-like glycosyltransferase
VTTETAAAAPDVERSARWATVAVLVLAAIAFAAVRAPLISVPLERDEGEYAYIAQRILDGDVPYRDAFDQKPPATFFVYAAAIGAFGASIESIHGFMYLWTACTAAFLFGCVRRRGGRKAAAFAVLVFAVVSADPSLTGNAANTEIFMLLPLVASVYCLLRALDSTSAMRWWILAGMAAGAACWFKQVAVTNVLFIAAVAAFEYLGPSRRNFALLCRAWLALVAGAVLVSVPLVAGFAVAGAIEPFVDAVFLHNLEYTSSVGWLQGREMLTYRLAAQAPSLAVVWALAGAAVLAARPLGVANAGFWLGWWVAAALGVSIGLFFRPHYFIQMTPALSALAGCGAAGAVARVARRGAASAAIAVAAAVLLIVVPSAFANRAILGAGDPNVISRSIYGSNPFVESPVIGRYIERTSTPNDTIYIVGSEPQILFYANRRSATRYIFFYPLTGDYPDVLARQQSVVEEIENERPLYVVWSNLQTSLLSNQDTEPHLFDFTRRLLAREYRLELLAHPISDLGSFEFVYGAPARKLMRAAGERVESAPWVALYRRRDRPGD